MCSVEKNQISSWYQQADLLYLSCSEALSRLNIVIRHPNALQSENVMAYDNAVSALGKICQFHRDSIDSAQVFLYSFWLISYLFSNAKFFL